MRNVGSKGIRESGGGMSSKKPKMNAIDRGREKAGDGALKGRSSKARLGLLWRGLPV
jgi:hypothetical protein